MKSLSLWMTIVLLSGLYLLCAPVSVLEIAPAGGSFLRRIAPVGQPFVFRYIHSIELTPVEDEYSVSNGTFWQWEERVRSHNAGLPLEATATGKFIAGKDWFRFRGGRQSFPVLYLRVGDEKLGRNELDLFGVGRWELYRQFPGERLEVRVVEGSFVSQILGNF